MSVLFPHPIIVEGTRILRPVEWEGVLLGSSLDLSRPWGPTFLPALLNLGTRYVESQRLQWAGTKWLEGSFVHLPKEALFKKRKQLERYVRLSPQGLAAVKAFLSSPYELPSKWGLRDALRHWARLGRISPDALSPKTTRKTWESWLTYYYRGNSTAYPFILQSQGHDETTSLNHYLGLPFLPEDAKAMEPYVGGWL